MGIESAGQFMSSPPSFTNTAQSKASGGTSGNESLSDFNTGTFNFGASSLMPLFIVGGVTLAFVFFLKYR